MKLTAPLLAKVGGGLVVATTLTTVGVVKKDSISSLFKSTDTKVTATNKLLKHLKTTGKDIVFKAYSGDEGETALSDDFSNFNDNNQTIRFSVKSTDSLTGETDNRTANELKKLLGTKDDLIWECKIKFLVEDKSKSWKANEKDIFYKTGSGFFQKITTQGHKLFKERFIKQCSELSKDKESIVDGSIKLKKQFNVVIDSQNSKIKSEEWVDYESWFGSIKLTEKEVKAIKDNWNFSLSINALTLADIKIKDEKISGCNITLSNSEPETKANETLQTLNKLFNHESSINKEKYREGFLKKCRNSDNSVTLTLDSNSNLNEKLKELFDFSREESKEIYEELTKFDKTMTIEGKKVEITVTVSSNNPKVKYECKIIGTTEEEGNITDEQKSKLEEAFRLGWGAISETAWKNSLKTYRGLFNDEITKTLKKKSGNTSEYDIAEILPK